LRQIREKAFKQPGRVHALLAVAAATALVIAGQAAGAPPSGHKTVAAKTVLRGTTWDSIKGLPDWSGMWTPGRPPAGTPLPPRPPGGGPGGFGGGFTAGAPFKPEFAAKNAARMKRVFGEGAGGEDDIPLSNSGFCIPGGVPGNMMLVSHEYAYSPGRIVILLENSEVRRIWTDGRKHQDVEEATPSFQGDSIGHWEGDTLVVETSNIYPEAEFGFGIHVTAKTVVNERFTRLGDKMRVETVITDPDLFTGPWTYTRWFDHENRDFVEYVPCTMADRAVKEGDRLKGINFDPKRVPLGDK
jgi:hypothetical protein